MNSLTDFNKYGEELEMRLLLKTSPIAIKVIGSVIVVAAVAFCPK